MSFVTGGQMSFFKELKRRNVIRVATAYVVASWLIIQVVETIFPVYGLGDTAIRTVITLLAVLFIPALVFSWVFEITPEGLKREVEVVREHSMTRFTGKQLDRVIMVLLALAIGYFTFDKFVLDPIEDERIAQSALQEGRSAALTESYGDRSIAVLPFANLSDDAEQEYFSDGLAEELLNLLSRIPGLRVISRSSAFSFKGKDVTIPEIARQLNVALVVEGSVRKSGERVRITAQLIEARSDTRLWSDTYDRDLDDIFAVQDEISAAMLDALNEHLDLEFGTAPPVRTASNADAHDAFLRGRFLVVQRTHADIEGAVREFEKAVALDPGYALAYAEAAIAYLLLHRGEYGDLSNAEAIARASPNAERAMAIDQTLAEAHAATGLLVFKQGDIEQAVNHFRQAIGINPNYSIVHTWLAILLNFTGRYEEAFTMQEKAVQLDPLSAPAIHNYALRLIERNRLDDAVREMGKIAATHPSWHAGLEGDLASLGGNWANWVLGTLDALRFVPDSPDFRRELSIGLAIIGLEQEARTATESTNPTVMRILGRPDISVAVSEARLAEDPNGIYARFELGLALAAAGDFTRARPILEEAWRWIGGRVAFQGEFQADHAAALIAIRREAGEGAGEILAAIEDNVRNYREAGMTRARWNYSTDFEEGLADLLGGDVERGLELMARAAQDGYLIKTREAYLQALYDTPGFASILADQEARQAREGRKLLDIVCIDNPYVAVWQPAEETCRQHFAEGSRG